MATLPILPSNETHIRMNFTRGNTFRLLFDITSDLYSISFLGTNLPPGLRNAGIENEIVGRFEEVGRFQTQLQVRINNISITLNIEIVVTETPTTADYYMYPTLWLLLTALSEFITVRVGDRLNINLDLGANTEIELTFAERVTARGRGISVSGLGIAESGITHQSGITYQKDVHNNRYMFTGIFREGIYFSQLRIDVGGENSDLNPGVDGTLFSYKTNVILRVLAEGEPIPENEPVSDGGNQSVPAPVPVTPTPTPTPVAPTPTPTPQITYQRVTRSDNQPATIDLEEPIEVPAGEEPTTTSFFFYTVGHPAATEFRIEFFQTEQDAQEGINPLTDVDGYLSYEIYPETLPILDPTERSTGYLTLTRLAAIPYTQICIKFSICQPDEPIKIGDTITQELPISSQQGSRINVRAQVFSNWNRR